MSQSNQKEYNRLFELYNKMSDEELFEITKPGNGYTELAISVASDILQSDRSEYYKKLKQEQQIAEEKQKIDKDNIFINMSKDIRSIKNMLIFFVILIVLEMISFLYLGYEVHNYFELLLP